MSGTVSNPDLHSSSRSTAFLVHHKGKNISKKRNTGQVSAEYMEANNSPEAGKSFMGDVYKF